MDVLDAPYLVAQVNPFPGLRSFEQADAHLFFGRDHQVQVLQDKLAHTRFLAVVGSSGSGKSSLVKAGLLPRLGAGPAADTASAGWRVAFLTPGATPQRHLAQALRVAFAGHPAATAALAAPDALPPDPATVAAWCGATPLLLFIDQFEELFRYQPEQGGRAEVTEFIDLLLALSGTPGYPVYVVLTMRSDFLDTCTDYPGLTEALNLGSHLLPKMSRVEIAQAITTPVTQLGARMSAALVARLLADLGEQADQLPILQHALMRTWNHWQRHRQPGQPLEEADYEAIGTIRRAITVHAEELFAALPTENSRLATEQLFKALVVLGAGNAGVVQPLTLAAISAITGVGVHLLADAADQFRQPDVAFLTPLTTEPATDHLIIDLGHERLLTLWERLHTWVSEELESAKFYQQLSHAATLYHAGKAGIWTNPELAIGLQWLATHHPTLAWASRYDPYLERAVNFLQYSKKQFDFKEETRQLRQRREARRNRTVAVVLAAGALVSLLFLALAAWLRTSAQRSAEAAVTAQQGARHEHERAESQAREAITQKKISDQQEAITYQQKNLTEEQRTLAERAEKAALAQQKKAETAQAYAEQQQVRALLAEGKTRYERDQANKARTTAEKDKEQAKDAQARLVEERSYSRAASKEAERQRGLAVARIVAIEAVQLEAVRRAVLQTDTAESSLPALLAQAAYLLNNAYKGAANNSDVFNALDKVTSLEEPLDRHTKAVRAVVLSAGRPLLLASGGDDGLVHVQPSGSPGPLHTYTTARKGLRVDGIRSLAFSPDGQQLYGGSESGLLYVWNVAQPGKPLVLKAHRGAVHTLLWQPRGATPLLASVSADGGVRTWQPRPGGGLDTLQRAHAPAGRAYYCAGFSGDGKQLVCGSDGTLASYAIDNLPAKPTIYSQHFGDRITALAYSADGKKLITGDAQGLLYTWEVVGSSTPQKAGAHNLLLGRHTAAVNDLVFSPDSKQVASGSADATMHLWDASALLGQQQPIVLTDFQGAVAAVCFTHDGKQLIGAGADRTVRIHTISIPAMYAQLTGQLTRTLTAEEWERYVGPDIRYPEASKK